MKNTLKKILAIVLVITCLFSVCGCTDLDWEKIEKLKENYDLQDCYVEYTDDDKIDFIVSTDDLVYFNKNITKEDVSLYKIVSSDEYEETPFNSISFYDETRSTLRVSTDISADEYDLAYFVKIDASCTAAGKSCLAIYDEALYYYNDAALSGESVTLTLDELKKLISPEKGLMDYISAGAGYYQKAEQVLIALGIIEKKDPYLEAADQIKATVDEVNANVKSMDQYLKNMNKSIQEQLDKIAAGVKESNYNLNSQTWNDYYDKFIASSGMQDIIDTFTAIYQQCYVDYFLENEGKTFTIYYDMDGNITYPISTKHTPGTDWYSIDGTLIDEDNVISFEITDETFSRVKALTKKVFDDFYFEQAVDNDLYDALLTCEGINQYNVESFLYDAYCVIETVALRDAMDSKTSSGAKLCNEIISRFKNFTSASSRSTGNPIEAYRKLITANYNFQSEAKADLDEFNRYIYSLLADFRAFAEMAVEYGSVSTSESIATIAKASDQLSNWLESNDGFVEEKSGEQYCYETGSYLQLRHYSLTQTMEMNIRINHKVVVLTGLYKDSSYDTYWTTKTAYATGTRTTPPSSSYNFISGNDAKTIYATYLAMKANAQATGTAFPENYKDYIYTRLNDYLATGIHYSSRWASEVPSVMLCDADYSVQDFAKDGSVSLECLAEAFSEDYFPTALDYYSNYFKVGKTYAIGTESEGNKAKATKFKAKTVKGNFVDLETGEYHEDESLMYGAIYGHSESKWKTDEAFIFGNFAELPNLENTTKTKFTTDAKDDWSNDYNFTYDMTLDLIALIECD